MLIAKDKREKSIAEYILYMWQVEDLIRANDFSMDSIRRWVIDPFDTDPATHEEMIRWYDQLIHLMKQEKIEQTGHCQFLINLVNDLHDFHLFLLRQEEENTYRDLYRKAEPFIHELEEKSQHSYLHQTDTSLHGLYGLLLLKLRKKPVRAQTEEAFRHISRYIALLSTRYIEQEKD